MYRRYTVRLFPTPKQEELMWKHVHVCRFVWNYMLALQKSRYENGRKYMSRFDMCKELTIMKKECDFAFLNEVSRHSLELVFKNMDDAYKMFWNKKHAFPKFKKKDRSKFSYPVGADRNATYFTDDNFIQIPKVGKVKCLEKFSSVDFKLMCPQIEYKKSSGKWILTFSIECENQVRELTSESMGIDLGIKDLAVVAVGDKKMIFGNINKSKRMRALKKKKKHIQRTISRKYRTFNGFGTPEKGQTWQKSRQIEKYEQILREIEAKMSNIRKNYIHKITRELVNMLPERVVMEDLDVTSMLKNKHLTCSISEQNFYFFIQTMKYKCEEYCIEFVQADRYFPSSKLCSCCGYKNKSLKLKDREWTCPNCGTHHDRDYNAAVNLMNYTETMSTTSVLVSTQKSGSTLVA